MKKFIIILLTILPFAGFSQIRVNLQEPPVKNLRVRDLWNVRINNPLNEQRRVYLVARINEADKGKIARFRAEDFNLPPGLKRFDPQKFKLTQEEYFNSQAEAVISRTGNFPSGNYTINLVLYNLDDDSQLASAEMKHKVVNVYDKSTDVLKGGKKKFVTFYGNAYVEGHTANRQGFGSQVPKEYVRGKLNSNLEFGPAPINVRAFYSTEDSDLRQNMNTFTVSFNDSRFINNLRNQLTKVIMNERSIKETKYGEAYSKVKKLDKLNRLLGSKKLQDQFKNVDNIDEVKNKVEGADLKGAVEEINQVKKDLVERKSEFNYETKKKRLKTEISVHKQVSYTDSTKERRRRQKIDSLQMELQELEQRQDSIQQENKADVEKLQRLNKKQKKYNKLKKKLNKLEELKARKKQFENLKKQKDKLLKYKKKLEESGKLDAIKSFDMSKLSDKQFLKQQLKKRGMLSTGENLLYSVEELAVGTIYPYYSPLVLNGIMVSGLNFEWNPGLFYMAFTGGTSNRPVLSINQGIAGFKQRLLAGKLGIGKKNNTHLYFSVLHALDDRNSINVSDSIAQPQANTILGTDFGLTLFKGNFSIQGELAGSKFDSHQQAIGIGEDNKLVNSVPDFLEPNISTALGLAYDVRGKFKFFKDNTLLSGYVRNIEPGYNSFGAPNLRTGIFAYQAKLSQKLFSDDVTVSVFRKNENTASLWTQKIAAYERMGGEVALRFSKFPRIRASYSQSVHNKRNTDKDLSELMVTASYGYGIGTLSLSNTVSYASNQGESNITEGMDYNISNYLFNQMISFQFPLSLSLNVNHIREDVQGVLTKRWISDLSASFQLFKKMSVGLGGSYKVNPDEQRRLGGFADLSYSFAKHFTFNLRFKDNYYDDLMVAANDYNEYIVNGRLIINW